MVLSTNTLKLMGSVILSPVKNLVKTQHTGDFLTINFEQMLHFVQHDKSG